MGKDGQRTIVFTHIMKTAGRSLNDYFIQCFGHQSVAEIYDQRTTMWDYVQMRRKGTIRLVAGHIDYGAHKYLGLDNVDYITFLRDPISRAISEYYFLRDVSTKHPYHKLTVAAGSLEGWLCSPDRSRNNQCYRLCGRECKVTASNALENLKKRYKFFGLVEHMDQSLELLCKTFSTLNAGMPILNSGCYAKHTTEEFNRLTDIYSQEDEMDRFLFESACKLFKQRYSQLKS